MYEILRHLPASARVLDIGCRFGSFDASEFPFTTVRLDLEPGRFVNFVQADAAALPFPAHSFDAVIANHSLEHFAELDRALAEIGRVVKPAGALFVAVPDASTFTDRLYRWLSRGGGHVNAFVSPDALACRIERVTSLPHVGTRVLHTSLSFLNPRNRTAPAPRRLWILAGGREPVLVGLNFFLRLADRLFGTRWSVYGWALWFGRPGELPDTRPAWHVCVRCGAGHSTGSLIRRPLRWLCPACGAANLFLSGPQS
ncbi:MAG TPA: class I SAM-dependent methyltransferase [Bryobacteraceae bacterium]|nr:class I SAM-dependent methyltransferase [Bryobacteraceae bacterium]